MTRISPLFSGATPTVSFEFFPPKTVAATDRLLTTDERLDAVRPDFVSVTYGAGGTTRTRTSSIVCGLNDQKQYPAMPHLTAVGHSTAEIKRIVGKYADADVHNLLVLAGDPPLDGDVRGDYRYATDVIDDVRSMGDFCIGVAAFPEGHPRSTDPAADRRWLAHKLERADFAITQFFFDAEHYFQMMDELDALGNTTPVIPGVMPVANTESIRRYAEMNGAEVDETLFAQLDAADESDRRAIAAAHAGALIETLIAGGAPGVHLYTLNKYRLALDTLAAAGLPRDATASD